MIRVLGCFKEEFINIEMGCIFFFMLFYNVILEIGLLINIYF